MQKKQQFSSYVVKLLKPMSQNTAATMYLQRLRRQLIGLNLRINIYHDLINTKILLLDYEVLEPNIVGCWKSALGSFYCI